MLEVRAKAIERFLPDGYSCTPFCNCRLDLSCKHDYANCGPVQPYIYTPDSCLDFLLTSTNRLRLDNISQVESGPKVVLLDKPRVDELPLLAGVLEVDLWDGDIYESAR